MVFYLLEPYIFSSTLSQNRFLSSSWKHISCQRLRFRNRIHVSKILFTQVLSLISDQRLKLAILI